MKQAKETKESAIGDWRAFDEKLLDIQRTYDQHDDPFIEVTEPFFQAMTKGSKTPYLTYGKPGVKVYKAGTKDGIDQEELLTSDQYRSLEIERAREAKGFTTK